jgi:CRP-like cAMP-binding protein
MSTMSPLLTALPAEGREHLMTLKRQSAFATGVCIFEEGHRANKFWIIQTGTVDLGLHVPGRHAAVVETLGPGDLLGWSWLLAPHTWHLGARAATPVQALEFDAEQVRALCEQDPVFGQALTRCIAEAIAHRLQAARHRLLDRTTSPTAPTHSAH